MRKVLTGLLMLALTACGGGGSSGDNGTGLAISFSTSRLDLAYTEGNQPDFQTMYATASGSTDKDVLLAAEVTGTGIATPIQVVIDTATRKATITVTAASLPAGTYTGTILMKACANQSCSVQHGGSPHTVNYTVTVRPGLTVSTQSVNLTAVETGTSAPASFTFSQQLAGTGVTASIFYYDGGYGPGYTHWLTTAISGNTVQLQAAATTLREGRYQARLTLFAPSTNQSVEVPVYFDIGAGMSAPAQIEVMVDSSTTAQQMQGSIPLALAAGATATTWYATSSEPWFDIDASGPFGTSPTWRINTAMLAAKPNDQTYVVYLGFSTDATLQKRGTQVVVRKKLAEIQGLDSVALLAGQGGDVMVNGKYFNGLAAGTGAVSVAGASPSTVTVLSDRVLRMSMPALAAGSYAVSLNAASGMASRGGALQVTSPATYAYQAFDTQGLKTTVVWDPVSKSAFVLNGTLNSIMRYAFVDGQFRLVTTRSFASLEGIGMTQDHDALVAMAGGGGLYKLSTTDLSDLKNFRNPMTGFDTGPTANAPLSIMGGNRMLHPLMLWTFFYDSFDLPLGFSETDYQYRDRLATWGAVSGNGQRMLWPDSGRFSPHAPMFRYEVATDKLESVPNSSVSSTFYRYAVDHDGNTWAFNNQVVDFNLNLKGNIELPDGWVGNEPVLSRNGSRLYYYAQNSSFSPGARVYVFDTSQPMTTSVNFPVLGYIDLADKPNCPYDPTGNAQDCYTFNTRMAIADDGQTLFLAGDRKFLVVPIPAALRSAATVQGSALSGQTRMPGLR